MSCRVAQTDQNGNMVLNCQDQEYIGNLIEALKKATMTGNKNMIRVYASELEKYKELCGSHPVLELFERQLSYTSNKLGLAQCPHVERALTKTPEQLKEAKRRFTMIGFDKYEINEDGTRSVVDPPKPQPKVQRVISDVEIALMNLEKEDQKPKKKPFEAERKWL